MRGNYSGPIRWDEFVEKFLASSPEYQQSIFHQYNVTSLRELEMIIRPFEYQLMNITEYVIHKHLQVIVPPIFIIIGTIGNILSCIILLRKPMIRVSTYVFLAVLAIVDTMFLYLGLFRIWLRDLTGISPIDTNDYACKILTFLGFTTSDLSVWIIVAVTTERYIAVCHPLKATTFCNVRRAKIVMMVITALLASINIHFLWTVSVKHVNEMGEDITQCDGAHIWPWIDGVIYSFLPFVVITVLNILIIRQIVEARKQRTGMTSSSGNQSQQDSGYKITVMLLTISFAFLICTLPKTLCMIFGALGKNIQDPKAISRYVLADTVTVYLMYVNHSMNFFLYCATGQKFRYELFRLIRTCTGREPHLMRGYASENTGSTINNGTIRDTHLSEYKNSAGQSLLVKKADG